MRFTFFRAILGAALLVTACSSQKGSSYAGEPVAQVRGTIVTSSSPPPAEATVILYWNNFARQGDTSEIATLPARGEFPAKFTIDIFSPPSPEQLNDFSQNGMLPNEARVGIATIYAVPPGPFDKNTPPLGVVEDYVVVYVERDTTPGTRAATFLGCALGAGFHLMKVTHRPSGLGDTQTACYRGLPPGLNAQETYARCHDADIFDKLHEAEQGFATDVSLKLAPEKDLDVPNYN